MVVTGTDDMKVLSENLSLDTSNLHKPFTERFRTLPVEYVQGSYNS
jgi:hypothetical protein